MSRKPRIFTFNGETYAVHCGAIYFWRGTHVSNIPYAARRKNGVEAYAKSLGQRPLTPEEVIEFEEQLNTAEADGVRK